MKTNLVIQILMLILALHDRNACIYYWNHFSYLGITFLQKGWKRNLPY